MSHNSPSKRTRAKKRKIIIKLKKWSSSTVFFLSFFMFWVLRGPHRIEIERVKIETDETRLTIEMNYLKNMRDKFASRKTSFECNVFDKNNDDNLILFSGFRVLFFFRRNNINLWIWRCFRPLSNQQESLIQSFEFLFRSFVQFLFSYFYRPVVKCVQFSLIHRSIGWKNSWFPAIRWQS